MLMMRQSWVHGFQTELQSKIKSNTKQYGTQVRSNYTINEKGHAHKCLSVSLHTNMFCSHLTNETQEMQ